MEKDQVLYDVKQNKNTGCRIKGGGVIYILRELYGHYHEDFDVRVRISADARERLRETMQSDEDHITTQADQDWRQTPVDKPDT